MNGAKRTVSGPYTGPLVVFDQDDLRFIRSILPLHREETKRLMPKLNAAIDNDFNEKAEQRADAIARGAAA